jgi:hypothetical protein
MERFMKTDVRHATNLVTGGVEYTFLVDGAPLPKDLDLKDYYIVRLRNFTYRIFKKVQAETDKAVLRRWNAEGREYLNLSWIPKGWSPSGGSLSAIAEGGADQWVSGIRLDSSMADCKAEDGQILYALPNDFDCLGAAEENLRLVDGLLSKTGGYVGGTAPTRHSRYNENF